MDIQCTHEADLEVACPDCSAAIGVECSPSKKVCFARRMANVCRDPEARARFESALRRGGEPEERN